MQAQRSSQSTTFYYTNLPGHRHRTDQSSPRITRWACPSGPGAEQLDLDCLGRETNLGVRFKLLPVPSPPARLLPRTHIVLPHPTRILDPPPPCPRTEQVLRAVMVVIRVFRKVVDLHADTSFQPWRGDGDGGVVRLRDRQPLCSEKTLPYSDAHPQPPISIPALSGLIKRKES